MRFASLCAAVCGLIATTVSADGAAINGSLTAIIAGTTRLNSSITNYDGTLFAAPPILDVASDLIDDIDSGTANAKKSANLTSTEAITIYTTVLNLRAIVNTTLSNIERAKPEFDKWKFGGVIQWTTQLTKKRTDILSAQILKKVPEDLVEPGQQAVDEIDSYFDHAIAFYDDYNSR